MSIFRKKRQEWFKRGDKFKEDGNWEKAIECYDQIIQTNQDLNGYAHRDKAECLLKLKSYEEAIVCFQRALEFDPDEDTVKFNLAIALYELGRRSESRGYFQQVAKQSLIYGLDRKARDWLEKLDLEEGIPTKKPQSKTEMARALEMMPDLDPRVETKETALFYAADQGKTEAVEILLRDGANPRYKAPSGWTPLLIAAEKGHADILRLLLEKGADPNDQNVFAAHTPLILAAMGNHAEVVRILIDAGADVNRLNQWGRTALSNTRSPEIRAILLEAGAKN